MSDEQIRTEFEAWLSKPKVFERPWTHRDYAHELAWQAWQAARAQRGEVDIYEDVYEQITDAIEPYVIRQGGNPDAFLPASAVESVHKLLNEALAARSRDGAEHPQGMFGLTRSQLLTIAEELREAADGMSDDDDPEAEHLMDLTFKSRTYGDHGIEEGPQLCVNLSEYPEEGVYPIDQTGNAEARKTRTCWAQDGAEVEPVAWRVSHPEKGWAVYQQYPDWAEGYFIIQPLYTQPTSAGVPELGEDEYEQIMGEAGRDLRRYASGVRGQTMTVQDGIEWHVMKATERRLRATPQPPQPDWTPCSERLPTAEDEDPYGFIHFLRTPNDRPKLMLRETLENRSIYRDSLWKPTGLTRPEPPEE